MFPYLARRLLNYVVLLFVAVTLTYMLAGTQLDPSSLYREGNQALSQEAVQTMLTNYNINTADPVLGRYGIWLTNVFTEWDWGRTPMGAAVNDEVSDRIWVSARLVTLGSFFGIVLGVALGAWAATRQYQWSDRITTFISLVLYSTSTIVIAVALQMLAIKFNQATDSQFFEFIGETGRHGDYWGAEIADRLQHLLLPTLTLTLTGVAYYSRIQRNLMLDTLGADYVRTARAKGLRKGKALSRHALRTALIPTGTYFAFSMATIFVGSAIVELVYGWHGMGNYGVTSIQQHDINGTVAVAAFAGLCVLVGAMLADIMVAVLDPRVRVS